MNGKNTLPVLSPSFKTLIVVIAVFSAAVLVDAVIGRDGIFDLRQKRQRHERLNGEVRELQQKMDRLEAERLASETDPQLLEQIAREKLGLLREGEVVYILQQGGAEEEKIDRRGVDSDVQGAAGDRHSTDIDGIGGE